MDWSSFFNQLSSPPPIEPVPNRTNMLWYGAGGLLLIGVIIALLVIWNNGNRGVGEETAVVTTDTPQPTAIEQASATAEPLPSSQPINPNQECPPKYPDGTFDDLPQEDVTQFYPTDIVRWAGNPDYLDPIKRHYYQGEITLGETSKQTLLGRYPDKCFIHTYIFNSQSDQVIEIRFDEDGLNGQASIIVDNEFGNVTEGQAVDGSIEFDVGVNDLRYVIRVLSWNFSGGQYELKISAVE